MCVCERGPRGACSCPKHRARDVSLLPVAYFLRSDRPGPARPGPCLASLRPVEEAVKDCSQRLVRAGPSVLLRGSTAQAQTTSPCLKPCVRQPNVFGAGVANTGKETRVPVAPTNHCIQRVRPSTHNSSRQVEELGLLCRLRRLQLTNIDDEDGLARSQFNDSRAVALAIIPNSEEISFEEF